VCVDAGTGGNAQASNAPDAAGAGAATTPPAPPTKCTPTANADEPDDAFTDSNCDGLDGDVAKAIFVAPTGVADGDGSATKPVNAIARGVELARAARKDVYLCTGEYPENVLLEGTGVRVFGGYDCANAWKRVTDESKIAPNRGIPVTVRGIADAVVLDHVRLI